MGYEGLSGRMRTRLSDSEISMGRGKCPIDFWCIAAKCAFTSYDYDSDDDNDVIMAISSE